MRYEVYNFSDSDVFGISAMGYSNDTSVTHFGPFVRDNYIIHYVLSGKGYFNKQLVCGGQGFLITPQMPEHYFPDSENPWEFIWIVFKNNSSICEIFAEYNADPVTNVFEFTNMPALELAKNIIIENNSKIYRPSELYEMFLHIFNNHSLAQKNETSAEAVYFNYAVKYIELNLVRKITVSELVSVLGVSQPYLYSVFMKKASVSPKQYIDGKRIAKAKELLLKTSMQLTQIANSVGIEDCITFSKFFKKKVGVSPSDFRKENGCVWVTGGG